MKISFMFCLALESATRMEPGVEPVMRAISSISKPSMWRIRMTFCWTDGSEAIISMTPSVCSALMMASSTEGDGLLTDGIEANRQTGRVAQNVNGTVAGYDDCKRLYAAVFIKPVADCPQFEKGVLSDIVGKRGSASADIPMTMLTMRFLSGIAMLSNSLRFMFPAGW